MMVMQLQQSSMTKRDRKSSLIRVKHGFVIFGKNTENSWNIGNGKHLWFTTTGVLCIIAVVNIFHKLFHVH